MYLNNFLNFLNAPASSGSISLNLQSYNASANVSLTLTATGLTAGLAPISCATTAISQFNTQLTQYGVQYAIPQLSDEIPAALFRVKRTEHIIDFFSECQFSLEVTDNDTGASIEVSTKPILATLDNFIAMSGIMTLGANLTTDQQILLLRICSDLITNYCNNLIVIAGYVQTFVGFYQRSFFLNQGLPVQSYDTPRVAPPGLYFYWWYIVLPWLRWSLNPEIGELYYQPNQNLLNWPEPSSLNYQIKVSYTAGNFNIPSSVIFCLAQLAKAVINDANGVKALKTGSFQIQYRDRTPIQTALQLMDDYVLW